MSQPDLVGWAGIAARPRAARRLPAGQPGGAGAGGQRRATPTTRWSARCRRRCSARRRRRTTGCTTGCGRSAAVPGRPLTPRALGWRHAAGRRPARPQAPLARRHRRPRAGRRPRDAPRGRHGGRGLREAADRRRVVLERDHPLQPVAGPAGQGGQERRARRGRLPDGVRHDLGLRRHLDGPRGHALLAGVARGDRRLRRDGDDGRAARRVGAARRLRQVAAGDADGGRAARPRERLPLRRLDHARPGRRPGRHDHRRVRGGRRLPRRARSAARRSTGSSGRSARARAPAAACTPRTRWPAVAEAIGMSLPGLGRPAGRRPPPRRVRAPLRRGRRRPAPAGDHRARRS